MNRLENALAQIAAALDEAGTGWALVGGLAVSVRTEPRFTRDVDIAVAVNDDSEAESLIRTLRDRGYIAQTLVEQEATGRLATTRLLPPGEEAAGVVVDLLFASSGIEHEIVSGSETILAMAELQIPVAGAGHLIAVKLLAEDEARPLDRADLVALKRVADSEELDRARRAVGLITDRGFARGRDLDAALSALLA